MKASMVVENPGDVRVTLTITMTVNQWELEIAALESNLKQQWNHDVAALRDAIRGAVEGIRQNVTSHSVKIMNE